MHNRRVRTCERLGSEKRQNHDRCQSVTYYITSTSFRDRAGTAEEQLLFEVVIAERYWVLSSEQTELYLTKEEVREVRK